MSGKQTSDSKSKIKTLLICHEGAHLDQEGLAMWLASFSDLVGMILLREARKRTLRRLIKEVKRVGLFRFLDVVAFRIYYALFLTRRDRGWVEQKLLVLRQTYPALGPVPVLRARSPNSPEAEEFIRSLAPDLMLARCKTLLKESVFSIPLEGTFVMHPGICPEYRNAHGCFWALANRDVKKVGMTLLKVDKGVDTGRVYGYYEYRGDEREESHVVIQARVVFDHLQELQQKLQEICEGRALPVDTSGRNSATWGQPWLTKYLYWKLKAKQNGNARNLAYLSRRD